jgi:hypothetical protein
MAISASGFYGLTLEKMFIDSAGQSMEGETHKGLLVTDTYTPAFDTHDFRDDVTNEIGSGGGYTTGGNTITTTEITLASGVLTWDFADPSWPSSTITNAMAHISYFNVGTAATDQLLLLLDFVTAVSTSNGTLTVQINAAGAMTLDYTP